ncbi:hypothetical protein ACIOMM_36490 [Streptomyces sp. NPDC087908]|uniref:hypothetical protein n=1 Tax=Streptomyces sp. NPDC087908 TaxID=3365820 RepID=UPI00382F5086
MRARSFDPYGGGSRQAGGTGGGGPAVPAQLHSPAGITMVGVGALYVADYGSHRVRKVTSDGTISGTGAASYGGDSGPAVSAPCGPLRAGEDASRALHIADASNHQVRKSTPGGKIATVAGTSAKASAGTAAQPPWRS